MLLAGLLAPQRCTEGGGFLTEEAREHKRNVSEYCLADQKLFNAC